VKIFPVLEKTCYRGCKFMTIVNDCELVGEEEMVFSQSETRHISRTRISFSIVASVTYLVC